MPGAVDLAGHERLHAPAAAGVVAADAATARGGARDCYREGDPAGVERGDPRQVHRGMPGAVHFVDYEDLVFVGTGDVIPGGAAVARRAAGHVCDNTVARGVQPRHAGHFHGVTPGAVHLADEERSIRSRGTVGVVPDGTAVSR